MTESLKTAFIAGSSAIAGGLLNGAYQHFREYISRPKLLLDFRADDKGYLDSAEYKVEDRIVSELFVRARVRNKGSRMARGCRVFIASLHEVQASGAITSTALHDSKQIPWAGYLFSAVDIPNGVNFYVDIVKVSKSSPGWILPVQFLFSSQREIGNYRGTYRFRLVVTADNAYPATCAVDVSYNGDWHNLRAVQISAE